MFSFNVITKEHFSEISEILLSSENASCDFTLGNMFMWGSFYELKYCIIDGFFIAEVEKHGKKYYSFPLGKGEPSEVIKKLIEFTAGELNLYSLSPDQLCYLNLKFPGKFNFASSEYGREYVYKTSSLAELPGRKYHQKKNFINRFYKNHSSVHIKEISDKNDLTVCKSISDRWFYDKYSDSLTDESEYQALELAFQHYFDLDFYGIILYSDEEAVAFSFGEKINNRIFNTHYEKTLPDYRDAYPVINREFAKKLTDYNFINREDDADVENLRKAKLSYHPDNFVYKYDAVYDSQNHIVKNVQDFKNIWKSAFGDSDFIIDSFFDNVYPEVNTFSLYIDNRLASAFYLIPCTLNNYYGRFSGYYLYAAATDELFKNRGLMSALIKSAVEYSSKSDFLILFPSSFILKDYYIKLGFNVLIDINKTKAPVLLNDSTAEYAGYVDENGFVCYPNYIYDYYKNFCREESTYQCDSGVGIIFNDGLPRDSIILTDLL